MCNVTSRGAGRHIFGESQYASLAKLTASWLQFHIEHSGMKLVLILSSSFHQEVECAHFPKCQTLSSRHLKTDHKVNQIPSILLVLYSGTGLISDFYLTDLFQRVAYISVSEGITVESLMCIVIT